jgi:hypothetical protein
MLQRRELAAPVPATGHQPHAQAGERASLPPLAASRREPDPSGTRAASFYRFASGLHRD